MARKSTDRRARRRSRTRKSSSSTMSMKSSRSETSGIPPSSSSNSEDVERVYNNALSEYHQTARVLYNGMRDPQLLSNEEAMSLLERAGELLHIIRSAGHLDTRALGEMERTMNSLRTIFTARARRGKQTKGRRRKGRKGRKGTAGRRRKGRKGKGSRSK